MLPFFSEEQVRSVLRFEDLIPAMEAALVAFSAGRFAQAARQMLEVKPHGGHFGAMSAAGEVGVGAKLVTVYPGNAERGLPTHLAVILLFRPETGEPLAIMDGRLITEMRTAAVSAAVTKHLMPPDSRVLALVGSGVQARAHLRALADVNKFDEVRVWSRSAAHAQQFAAAHGARAMNLEAAVRGADVIVTATNSLEPLVRGEWLKPGAHLNSVGSPRPTWRELDNDVMHNTLVVDSREAVLKESGDVILSGAPIFAEAGEIFAGTKSAQRSRTTVFKSVGIAAEDIATARLVYDAVVGHAANLPAGGRAACR